MEAEHAHVAKVADGPAVDCDAEGMRCVVDEPQVVAAGDIGQCIKLAGMAVNVHGQDRRRPGRDGRLNRVRIEGIVIRFDIHEDRADFVPVKGVGGGNECKGGGDDLARNAHALEADLQGQRAIVEQANIGRIEEFRKHLLVAANNRTAICQPSAVPDFFQTFGKLFQRGQKWSGNVNRFVEFFYHVLILMAKS